MLQNVADEERSGTVSEDCLTVDIYIPRYSEREAMGILYWIHGGSYVSGDAKFYSGIHQGPFSAEMEKFVNFRARILSWSNCTVSD